MYSGPNTNSVSSVKPGALGGRLHRLDELGQRLVHVEREALERQRPRDVAQVVEHALDLRELALDRALEASRGIPGRRTS